ncbi:hypothetical protein [Streptomyces sp. NBC_01508]|uniref:hypothetical protein n=1 Tax=Streptomyces sp. NBC_01508 TaxID=2903888 RepID=UPI00386E8EF5
MDFDFRAELKELAEKIRRDPLLELFEFEMGDPVPEETIKAAEARFGTPLPTPLRQLYQSLGSVNLYWCLKSRLDERTRQRITKRHTNMISDSGLFDGAIRIVALEDMLFDEDFTMPQLEWKEGEEPEFDFAGTVYTDNEFSRMVRHFDAVDNYYAMSFIVQPDLVDWKMMFLGGHWIDADYSRVTYLEDYLRYVIATRGSVHARRELFAEYRGDRREPLRYDPAVAAGVSSAPSDK